jgi:hypothetical protein
MTLYRRERIMRLSSLRYSVVGLGVAGLVVAGLPAATAGAAPSKTPAVGDRCLIGTWRDNHGVTSTKWNGHTVKMRAGGRDFDHISASGIDRDGWNSSKPLVGKLAGHRLTERVRGTNTLLFRAHRHGHVNTLVETEKGWGKHSINRYVYRGKHSTGYLNQTGTFTLQFRCSLTTLTYLGKKGRVRGTETRVSFEP